MNKNRSPYRVPILRLSDVYDETEATETADTDTKTTDAVQQDTSPVADSLDARVSDQPTSPQTPEPATPETSPSVTSTTKKHVPITPTDPVTAAPTEPAGEQNSVEISPPPSDQNLDNMLLDTDMPAVSIPLQDSLEPDANALKTAPFDQTYQVKNKQETTPPATTPPEAVQNTSTSPDQNDDGEPSVLTDKIPLVTQESLAQSPLKAPSTSPESLVEHTLQTSTMTLDNPGDDPLDIWEADAQKKTAEVTPESPDDTGSEEHKETTGHAGVGVPVAPPASPTTVSREPDVPETPEHQDDVPAESAPSNTVEQAPPAPNQTPEATTTTAPTTNTNLASLRERVMHESMGRPLGNEVPDAAGESPVSPEERKKKLIRSDLHTLHETHTSLDTTSAPVSEPMSAHAQAVADIAHTLKSPDHIDQALKNAKVPSQTADAAPSEVSVPGTLDFTQETPVSHGSLPTMRTFRGDVEATVTRNRTSVVDMIAAQEKKRTGDLSAPRMSDTGRTLPLGSQLLLWASGLLVLAACVVAVLYALSFTDKEQGGIPGLFITEETQRLNSTGMDRAALMQELVLLRDSAAGGVGTMTAIEVVEDRQNPETGETESVVVRIRELFQKLETRAPASLLRSIDDSSVFGIYEGDAGNQPFLVIKSVFYDNTYSGAVGWEEHMQADLAPLFGKELAPNVPLVQEAVTPSSTETLLGTTTIATSSIPTPPRAPVDSQIGSFEDKRIANLPARVLRDTEQAVVLVWAMPDKDTLIITTTSDTLVALNERLTARTY